MKKIAITTAVLTLFAATSAHAQWIYQTKDSAFSDDKMHFMVTAKAGFAFGFRCNKGVKNALYLTSEKAESASSINALGPKLFIRVDKNKVHELDAEANIVDGKIRIDATVPETIFAEARDAKRRISVVLDIVGQKFYENNFNVRGSTRAAKRLIADCKEK